MKFKKQSLEQGMIYASALYVSGDAPSLLEGKKFFSGKAAALQPDAPEKAVESLELSASLIGSVFHSSHQLFAP